MAAGRSVGADSEGRQVRRDVEPRSAINARPRNGRRQQTSGNHRPTCRPVALGNVRQAIPSNTQTSLQTLTNGGPQDATGVWSGASPQGLARDATASDRRCPNPRG